MKRTELQQAIEEIITEILSESDTDKTRGTAIVPRSTSPSTIKKYTDQGVDVEVRVNEEEDDDSMPEKEPTKAELRKNAGVAKVKDELAKVIKKMKDLAKEYSKAEGDKKDKIKDQLKSLTAEKKDLEKRLDKFL